MPKHFDPASNFDLVLNGDKGKSPEPTFVCRVLTVGHFRDFLMALQNIQEATNQTEIFDEALAVLDRAIVGWRGLIDPETNEEVPFERNRIAYILDTEEAVELVSKMVLSGRLDESEAKKSE